MKDLFTPKELKAIDSKVNALIGDKTENEKIHDILNSETYNGFWNKLVDNALAAVKSKSAIKVVFDDKADTASTDGENIYLNPSLHATEKDFEIIHELNQGYIVHEFYHLLFTKFSLLRKIKEKTFPQLFASINNIIEDASIEYFGNKAFPGSFRNAVAYLNNYIFNQVQEINETMPIIQQLLCALSTYGCVKKIKGKCSNEILLNSLLAILDKARETYSPSRRFDYSEQIYEEILRNIDISQDIPSPSKVSIPSMSDMKGEMSENTDSQSTMSEKTYSDIVGKDKKSTKESKSGKAREYGEKTSGEDNNKALIDSLTRKAMNELKRKTKEKEINKSKQEKADKLSGDTDYGVMHKDRKNDIQFIDNCISHKAAYEKIVSEYTNIINLTANKIKKQLRVLKPRTARYQKKGLVTPSGVSSPRLFSDKRIFEKKKMGKDLDIGFTLLVDLSGSMDKNQRINKARVSTIILAEVLNKVGVPFEIIGFSEEFYGECRVMSHIYRDFSETHTRNYALANMQPLQNNRDGYSIRFAGERLAQREFKQSILIVISDGEPYAEEYNGYLAIKDVKEVVNKLEKKYHEKVIAFNLSNLSNDVYRKMYSRVVNVTNGYTSIANNFIKILAHEIKK